jgi:hypothetical protein
MYLCDQTPELTACQDALGSLKWEMNMKRNIYRNNLCTSMDRIWFYIPFFVVK